MNKNNNNEWISAKEAAKIIGVHHYTLLDWLKIKDEKISRLPYRRLGRRYRFKREDIEKFIDNSMSNT